MPLRRKNMDGLVNEYELQQQAQIARNKQHLESLNIPTLSNTVQPPPAQKRTKVSLVILISSCEHRDTLEACFETLMAAVVLSFVENLSCTH